MVRHPFFAEAWIEGPPDWPALWEHAEGQSGFFTTEEARSFGIRRALLSYHKGRGTFDRMGHGLYRLAGWPVELEDPIRIAWMTTGRRRSIASHWSALFLHDLMTEPLRRVDLIVPRAWRRRIPPREEQWERRIFLHAPRHEPEPSEITVTRGIRTQTAERALVEVARTRKGFQSVDVHGAIERGLTTWERLEESIAALRGPGSARARRELDGARPETRPVARPS